MSALEKLEITIADRLHDFTDKERMPVTAEKPKIVDYIRMLLVDLLKEKIYDISKIRSSRTFAETVANLSEDNIVAQYYENISNKGLSIETIDDLYDKSITDFLYSRKHNIETCKPLVFPKKLFKYAPQWLHSLYGGDKSFMMDVTLLTEQDICAGIHPSKNNLILKSIATEYDRNVENKNIPNCSSVYSPEPGITLLTKTENELLGFDSIHYIDNKTLQWRLKDEKGTINIDNLISIKSSGLKKKDANDSLMGLPLFLKFISDILNDYIKTKAFNKLDEKIQESYGISFKQFGKDYTNYILCLTDLKSMGDLLQVKMAQLSNSIFISNDRVTCLMSSICYNNPTVRTRKTKETGKPSVRELFIFDESETLLSTDIKAKLKAANEERKKQEKIIQQNKINFIKLLKDKFLKSDYIKILTEIQGLFSNIIEIYKTYIEDATAAILPQGNDDARVRSNIHYFNYSIYQYRIIVILLNYYLGFITLLINIASTTNETDTILLSKYDNFINCDIDSSIEDQENYISLSLTLLYSNVRDLLYYIIPDKVSTKRLEEDFIDEISLFNYSSYNIIKCYRDLYKFNIRSRMNYVSIKIKDKTYQVGFSYSAETLRKFEDTIIELQEMSEDYLQEINKNSRQVGGGRETRKRRARFSNWNGTVRSNKQYTTKKIKLSKQSLKQSIQRSLKQSLQELELQRLSYEEVLENQINQSITDSTNLVDTAIEFLINYLDILKKYLNILKSKFRNQETQDIIIQYDNIKNNYQFTCVLLFQILFIVYLYDIALPVYNASSSQVSLHLIPAVKKDPISVEDKDKLLNTIYNYSEQQKELVENIKQHSPNQYTKLMNIINELIESSSPTPMDTSGGSISKKQFKFSQKFISQLANRLTL